MEELYTLGYKKAVESYINDLVYFIDNQDKNYINGYIDGWTDEFIRDKNIDSSIPIEILQNIIKRI